jgi:magnesium transporter
MFNRLGENFPRCRFLFRKNAILGNRRSYATKDTNSVNAKDVAASHMPSAASHTTMRTIAAIKIDHDGKVETNRIVKQQLANELGLHLRDLRAVDPNLPSPAHAIFTVRPKAILFCIENIKVIVTHNEALLFNPAHADVQEFIKELQRQQFQAASLELAKRTGQMGRFEHLVLEVALKVSSASLFRRVQVLSPAVGSALYGLKSSSRSLDVIRTQLDELLPLKSKVAELRKRVRELKTAINDLLSNDEELLKMFLLEPTENYYRRPVPESTQSATGLEDYQIDDGDRKPIKCLDTMSLETLLENYYNEVEWISSEVEDIVYEIGNTEDYVQLQLDLLRNRMIQFDLTLTIGTFSMTTGAMVAGLYGMNVDIPNMEEPETFFQISGVICAGMGLTFAAVYRQAKRKGLI